MNVLDRVAIRVAPLSNRIVLARFGKDQNVALETKDAMSEVLQAVVQYAFDGKMPEKGEKMEVSFGGGDEQFILHVERAGGPAPAKSSEYSEFNRLMGEDKGSV